jgi:hypothetical protein
MCQKGFKKVDHIDCKIIAFEVKKRALFTAYKMRSTNFGSSWLNFFAIFKMKAFDSILGN